MLIVSNKATVAGLKELGLLPMIDVVNYGAVKGRNEWTGRNIVTLGRNQVPMKSVEDDVMALTGMPVERVKRGTYPLMDKMFMMRRPDGPVFHLHTQNARHPNELVELTRTFCSTGELTQAGARDRALREDPNSTRLSVRLALSSEVLDQPINANFQATRSSTHPAGRCSCR